jgi:hypothetical protein
MDISGLARKLLIKAGQRIAIVNAPEGFLQRLGPLPDDVEVVTNLEPELGFILLFVRNADELQKLGPKAVRSLKHDAMFWISYPKKSSKMKSDITRDVGWNVIEAAGLEGVAQIAVDETWSASRFRPKELVKSRKSQGQAKPRKATGEDR